MSRLPDLPEREAAVFFPDFRDDPRHWVAVDRKLALRILDLVEVTLRDPFRELGKPEPLRSFGSDVGSRRISREHRIVYRVHHDRVDFLQARYHY